MSSKGLLRGASLTANAVWHTSTFFPTVAVSVHRKLFKFRSFSSTTTFSSLPPPDLPRLAKTAQISLTPNEVEEITPKIQQVIEWFGQLQGVDLESIEPSIRADTENNLRENAPETFEHRDALIASVPSYEEPYIKVPRVLSME